jgi:hypothetical protein
VLESVRLCVYRGICVCRRVYVCDIMCMTVNMRESVCGCVRLCMSVYGRLSCAHERVIDSGRVFSVSAYMVG